jgi:hypothetical protein
LPEAPKSILTRKIDPPLISSSQAR